MAVAVAVVEYFNTPSALSDASEHRVTTVVLGDVVNQLHDDDGLADTSTTEETNLATLGVGGQQVNDLDTRDEDVIGITHVLQSGGSVVDGEHVLVADGTTLVNRLTNNVDDSAKGGGTDGNLLKKNTHNNQLMNISGTKKSMCVNTSSCIAHTAI